MKIRTIGAFYGKSGRVEGAEAGAACLKTLADSEPFVEPGPEISLAADYAHNSPENVCAVCGRLKDAVSQTMADGRFALVLGGDHSIAIGSVAAVMAQREFNSAVVYIDAHADMNTFATSLSKNIHGMPLAVCFGIETSYGIGDIVSPRLGTDRVLLLGTRSIDPGEAELIASRGIRCIKSDALAADDFGRVESELKDFIATNHIDNLHISFDIDVIDPRYAPATGVPEDGGITVSTAMELIDMVFRTGLVRSMDFVEYNPLLDNGDMTGTVCAELLQRIYVNMQGGM